MSNAEEQGELIYTYDTNVEMTPLSIGEEILFTGRLHCLVDAERNSRLSPDDMDIDVTGCLVYGIGEDGSEVGYDTSAVGLWEAYINNR